MRCVGQRTQQSVEGYPTGYEKSEGSIVQRSAQPLSTGRDHWNIIVSADLRCRKECGGEERQQSAFNNLKQKSSLTSVSVT